MFAFLRGTLHAKSPEVAVVDVGGVGYEVRISLSTYYGLADVGGSVALRITTQVRADAISLYGFLEEGEQRLFAYLVSVSGVGARMALAILSGMTVAEAALALTEKDVRRLQAVPGIGRKTAERLVVELKDKACSLLAGQGATGPTASAGPARPRTDVISALVNLGYPEGPASRAVDQVLDTVAAEPPGFDELLRQSLGRLHRN